MDRGTANRFGDFALFGFSQKPTGFFQDRISDRLGVKPRIIHFGRTGSFYFYTSYGDVAETDDLIGLKLGFARTSGLTPLSTRELLAQKLLTPQRINAQAFRGSALVVCLNKLTAEFSAYQTVLATPQLYYTADNGDILCSSSQRCLAILLDRLELNEEILPFHFMFQQALGPLTYFRNVHRLFPGQQLHWREGQLTVNLAKDLRFEDNSESFGRIDLHSVNAVYERLRTVIGSCIDELNSAGYEAANLLSGGVDSAIIQLIINEKQSKSDRPRSYSYAVHLPGFSFEVDYAREASQLLSTQHDMADIWPADFPDILSRAVEVVAQPVPAEADACKIAMVEFLASRNGTPRFFFSGQGADAVFGMGLARKVAILNLFRRIPAARQALTGIAKLCHPRSRKIAGGLSEIARSLSVLDDVQAYHNWPNLICTGTNLEVARRCFGDGPLHKALEYRRNLEGQYLGSSDLTERLHAIDLLSVGCEPAMFSNQMFLAHKKEQIFPFLDEDVIRIARAFEPRVRFLKSRVGFISRRNIKPLLKQIIIHKGLSSIAEKRKGGSAFDTDLFIMMKNGPLHDMVQAIDRPGFLSKPDFEMLLDKPDYFLWNLLTFDIFQKRVLEPKRGDNPLTGHYVNASGDEGHKRASLGAVKNT